MGQYLKLPDSYENQSHAPSTLIDVLSHAAHRYPSQELSFIPSADDSSIQTKTFSSFNQAVRNLARALCELNKPPGSIIIICLTEHEDNMAAIWACLLAGHVACLQPPLSAFRPHKKGHIAHITKVTGSVTWLTSEGGADQLRSAPDLEVHLLSKLRVSAESHNVPEDWVGGTVGPDDKAILFLTSGSTGFSKVVVHTHRTILSACMSKGTAYGLTSETNILNWIGFHHVTGSLEMHMTPLLFGSSQVHVHPSVILSHPLRFLRLIEEKSINVAFAPNFLLAQLVRDLEKRTDLFGTFDLSSIQRINSSGEGVFSNTAVAFAAVLKSLTRDPSKLSLVISPGFGMTETCAGCIHNPTSIFISEPRLEFLELGSPNTGCEMRIVNPEDGVSACPDGESGELQVRGPMLFVGYYNDPEATQSSFVAGGWFRTGDIGIIQDESLRLCGRIKETIIVHGVSYGIPELETQLQTVEGVMDSFLAVAPYRAPGQQTEGFIIFYSPTFDLDGKDASVELVVTHRALRDISVRMITLPPEHIVPIPVQQIERATLGTLSRGRLLTQFNEGRLVKYISRTEELLREAQGESSVMPGSETEKGLARIYASTLNLDIPDISAAANFLDLGATVVDLVRLQQESQVAFDINISAIQILKRPVLSSLACYIDALKSNNLATEEYDPIVPMNTSGNKTPIFMVHPGGGDPLILMNLTKYFRDERPFYAFRARGFNPGESFFASLDEIATVYTAGLKRTQPHGPYAIAGYSVGGAIVFEIAKRLEAMGDEVKFMGIMDIPPDISIHANDMTATKLTFTLAFFLDIITKEQTSKVAPLSGSLSRKEMSDLIWTLCDFERLRELNMDQDSFDQWAILVDAINDCFKSQKPSGTVFAVDVFYAQPPRGTIEDWLNKQIKTWTAFSREEPTFTAVPGMHHTMIDTVNVSTFQRAFRSCLEARGV